MNLIGYITRRLSADSQQLWIANENRSPIYFDQSRSFKFQIVYHEFYIVYHEALVHIARSVWNLEFELPM